MYVHNKHSSLLLTMTDLLFLAGVGLGVLEVCCYCFCNFFLYLSKYGSGYCALHHLYILLRVLPRAVRNDIVESRKCRKCHSYYFNSYYAHIIQEVSKSSVSCSPALLFPLVSQHSIISQETWPRLRRQNLFQREMLVTMGAGLMAGETI